jgi:hypothetical protein
MYVVLGVVSVLFLIGLAVLLALARRTERDVTTAGMAEGQTTDAQRRARQLGIALTGPQSTFGR